MKKHLRGSQFLTFTVVDCSKDDEQSTAYIAEDDGYYYDDDDDDYNIRKIRQWGWKEDDILELSHTKDTTVSKETSNLKDDNNVLNMAGARLKWSYEIKSGEIGLNEITRNNLCVDIGDQLRVKRIRKIRAKQIKISPTAQVNSALLEEYMKKNYMDCVFTKGDVFPIRMWPKGKMWFVVSDIMPDGPVYFVKSTKLILGSKIKNQSTTKLIHKFEYGCLGGLDDQIQKIREMIDLLMSYPEIFKEMEIDAPKGILLHGPPGTGKTLLAHTIGKASNVNFKSISGPEVLSKWVGESEENLRRLFEDARDNQPCIIFIDEIDAITPKRDSVGANYEKQLVAQLLTLMDGLKKSEKVVVIAATNMPNSIDPALRRPGRFDREVEISIPDQQGRLAILEIHTKKITLNDRVNLKLISKITHGYTGADLYSLCQKAIMRAINRIPPIAEIDRHNPPVKEYLSQINVTWSDFKQALKDTTPSALREVVVQVPNVKWEDIGGLDQALATLRESIEWPLKYSNDVNKYRIRMPRGILLHGSPGTGKTTIAKAVANTSGYNFVSIKGPELLSMWVGASEKGVREIFKKAKQASPCVIFFDEIDALTPNRGANYGSHVTDNVVSQIMTEMDGLEELQNVVVIGATNRLDIIDPAMLRPGRFDRIVKIPMPDRKGRMHILKIHTKKKPMDTPIDIEKIADITNGFSGADLEYVVELAAMDALRRHIGATRGSRYDGAARPCSRITQNDMLGAVDQIRLERRIGTDVHTQPNPQ